MTLTPICSLESARRKFFMNSTYKMSRKKELARSNELKRFWAQEAEMTLTPISSLESARRKFFMNSPYIMSRR